MSLEYIIYTDESVTSGAVFSHFYGGALVRSPDLLAVENSIRECMRQQNLLAEIKWSKVTEQYFSKYDILMNHFFDLVAADRIKIRIMFIPNRTLPATLSPYQREHQFFLLYYQFIKHAFGLRFSGTGIEPIGVRLYLDQLPDTREKAALFKSHLTALARGGRCATR